MFFVGIIHKLDTLEDTGALPSHASLDKFLKDSWNAIPENVFCFIKAFHRDTWARQPFAEPLDYIEKAKVLAHSEISKNHYTIAQSGISTNTCTYL